LTLLGGIQVFLFCTAVACVLAAFVMARRRRRQSEAAEAAHLGGFWLGRPASVKPAIGIGWALFILLNTIGGIAIQPLIACGLFMRAYVLRAVCLRRRSRPSS
jgi:hypothetical protein